MTANKLKACPECGSSKIWKDGFRYTRNNQPLQRCLCRLCGFRFSESVANRQVKVNVSSKNLEQSDSGKDFLQPDILQGDFAAKPLFQDLPLKAGEHIASHGLSKQTRVGKRLYVFPDYSRERQVCVSEAEGTKNLEEEATRFEKATGAGATTTQPEFKGMLVSLSLWMLKQGYKEATIYVTGQRLKHLVKLGAQLFDCESVKETIAKQQWQESTKISYIDSYARLALMQGLKFTQPNYKKPPQKLPFIPTENELNELIASCSRKVMVFLQLLKETGMRSGEVFKLQWKDFDFIANTVRVNNPEKNGNPRMHKISDKLVSMLKSIPQKSDMPFRGSVHCLRTNFTIQRKRAAENLKNPRLLNIHFHTFRHWKATMEYHKTKDILHVMRMLGHKSINSTLLYTQLVNFEGDEYDVKVAETKQEIIALLEAGFEWVGQEGGLTYFRRRK